MHMLPNSPDNWGMITQCDIVTLELCLRECYRAMLTEAISEDNWLHIDVGRDNNVRFVK